jgi:hypothetical protein
VAFKNKTMKKPIRIFSFILIGLMLFLITGCSKTDDSSIENGSKTLKLTTSGTLLTSLTVSEKSTITNLTLKGVIDARDFVTMRDSMPKLAVLDLSGSTIVDYNGTFGTEATYSQDYPANTVPYYAFWNRITDKINLNLINIKLPSSVTSIGDDAFAFCNGLTSISIPSSVTSIGNFTFLRCIGLTSITIPSSVTSIGSNTFFGCSGLTSFTIPSSVTSIGDYAFYYCSTLTSIYVYPTTPVNLNSSSEAFEGVPSNCTLYVPKASLSTYKTAQIWDSFTNIVGM